MVDYKALYRKLEHTINGIERLEDNSELLSSCLESLVASFSDDLGFVGGRIYEHEDDGYVLRKISGRSATAPIGYRIPESYDPIQTLLREGLIIMKRTDAGFDTTIEGAIGVDKFAAISVGDDREHLISLTIDGPIDEEHTLYALNAVRHIINMRLRHAYMQNVMAQAKKIQLSMLPMEPPDFSGFDIHGESRPAESVGGDLFDFIPQSERMLGVAIADASGHGLPAALQARDVITGMRMGMDESLKIVSAIERLNRVIYRSRLSSRFVSLFYGELESNGNFIYCNAGHPPALHLREGVFTEFKLGGLVLGPNPTARYERGFFTLKPGDVILMYTDGVTEAMKSGDEEFGLDRLKALMLEKAEKPAREIVGTVFDAVDRFTGRRKQSDDRTVVIVRKS